MTIACVQQVETSRSSIAAALNQVSFRKAIWILAIAETLHNIEEAIWLPEWSRTAGAWHAPVSAFEFRFAAAMFTLLVYAVLYYFYKRGTAASRYLVGGVLVVILFNVFVPHLAATIVRGRYAPGVGTGVLLNTPFTIYLLRRGLREGVFTRRTLMAGTAMAASIALPLLVLSFALARALEPAL